MQFFCAGCGLHLKSSKIIQMAVPLEIPPSVMAMAMSEISGDFYGIIHSIDGFIRFCKYLSLVFRAGPRLYMMTNGS